MGSQTAALLEAALPTSIPTCPDEQHAAPGWVHRKGNLTCLQVGSGSAAPALSLSISRHNSAEPVEQTDFLRSPLRLLNGGAERELHQIICSLDGLRSIGAGDQSERGNQAWICCVGKFICRNLENFSAIGLVLKQDIHPCSGGRFVTGVALTIDGWRKRVKHQSQL